MHLATEGNEGAQIELEKAVTLRWFDTQEQRVAKQRRMKRRSRS